MERLHDFIGRQVVPVLHQQHLVELARLVPVLERKMRLGKTLDGRQVRLVQRVRLTERLHGKRVVFQLERSLAQQERKPLILVWRALRPLLHEELQKRKRFFETLLLHVVIDKRKRCLFVGVVVLQRSLEAHHRARVLVEPLPIDLPEFDVQTRKDSRRCMVLDFLLERARSRKPVTVVDVDLTQRSQRREMGWVDIDSALVVFDRAAAIPELLLENAPDAIV